MSPDDLTAQMTTDPSVLVIDAYDDKDQLIARFEWCAARHTFTDEAPHRTATATLLWVYRKGDDKNGRAVNMADSRQPMHTTAGFPMDLSVFTVIPNDTPHDKYKGKLPHEVRGWQPD